jgi:hypothetical protein
MFNVKLYTTFNLLFIVKLFFQNYLQKQTIIFSITLLTGYERL